MKGRFCFSSLIPYVFYLSRVSFTPYRSLVSQTDDERTWFDEPSSTLTTRAIVERRPITPSDDETSFA